MQWCFALVASLLAHTLLVHAYDPSDAKISTETIKAVPEAECTRKAAKGDTVAIHYIASLPGKEQSVFDREFSRGSHKTYDFIVGGRRRNAAVGLDMGVVDMCIGEKRRILVPPELAYLPDPVYGYSSAQKAPYGKTLQFDVYLVKIVNSPEDNVFTLSEKEKKDLEGAVKVAAPETDAGAKKGMEVHADETQSEDEAAHSEL